MIGRIASLGLFAIGGALATSESACQVIGGFDDPLPAPVDAGGRADTSAESGTPEAGTSPPVTYGAAVLVDRPALYLRFEETSGRRLVDSSGNGADVVLPAEPVRGPSLAEGGNSSVRLGAVRLALDAKFDYPSTSPFTYELWIRSDAVPESQNGIFANTVNNPELNGTTLWISAGDPFVGFERWLDGVQVRKAFVPTPIAWARPVHLVLVNRPGAVTLFVNGQSFPGEPVLQGDPPPASLTFGFLSGDYDELAIYDHALEDARIRAHFALGIGE